MSGENIQRFLRTNDYERIQIPPLANTSLNTDIVDSETRSRVMASIKGKNTGPELVVRSLLHRLGFRFRVHRGDLPGKPDIVLPKYNAVIFVHGCFWHGHDCPLFSWPKTRRDFWRNKIESNVSRDQMQMMALSNEGWRIGTVWECALRGRVRLPLETVATTCASWLESNENRMELRGDETRTTL